MTILDRVSEFFGEIAAWLVTPLILIMCYEVFCRYVLGAPTSWSYELSYMLTAANYLLAFAVVLRFDENMRVDILNAQFPPRIRALVDLLLLLFILCPLIYLIVPALSEHLTRAWIQGERTGQSSWNPPVWPFRLVYVMSFVLLGVQVVSEIFKKARVVAFGAEQELTS